MQTGSATIMTVQRPWVAAQNAAGGLNPGRVSFNGNNGKMFCYIFIKRCFSRNDLTAFGNHKYYSILFYYRFSQQN